MFKPSNNFITGRSKGGAFLWILLLFGFQTVLSVPCSIVVTCWERADLLYMMFSCVSSLSHMVSLVSCGILLYGFLIFAFFLTMFRTSEINFSRL